ncbi:endonuclease VII domain-containing protein [Modestobacter lacusdianchii]
MKPLTAFPTTPASRTGRHSYCKSCHNARGRASLAKVGGSRSYHLTRRYGITADQADQMLADQGGLCGLCRAAPAHHVDHDHATGAVRDLLCFNCNGGLGQFKDDPALLRAAARYVEAHSAGRAAQGDPAVRALVSPPQSPPVVSSQRPPGAPPRWRRTRLTSTDGRLGTAGEVDG